MVSKRALRDPCVLHCATHSVFKFLGGVGRLLLGGILGERVNEAEKVHFAVGTRLPNRVHLARLINDWNLILKTGKVETERKPLAPLATGILEQWFAGTRTGGWWWIPTNRL